MMAHYVKFTEKSGRKVNMNKKERAKRWSDGEDYNRYIIEEMNSFRKNAWKKQITDHFVQKLAWYFRIPVKHVIRYRI